MGGGSGTEHRGRGEGGDDQSERDACGRAALLWPGARAAVVAWTWSGDGGLDVERPAAVAVLVTWLGSWRLVAAARAHGPAAPSGYRPYPRISI
ncbi:hypothetical protein E2562_019141 [Oryza meyeriana var. granulata]|uniref:Uncharacterized protein n=1 Tax=Oryza meyeriana var. granulata TaxID=110450 RepID=A0A6G1CRP5_9ORYZ|nr:hypothetical protein E2562_019141 [Oryza meyeriana var. granulata]